MEWLGDEAGDRLHLISSQPKGRLHSQLDTGRASLAEKRGGREQASIHPLDASERGIAEGDVVRLSNARGACLATAKLTENLRRGVIVLPTGAWFTPDPQTGCDLAGNPNVLTPDIPTSGFGQGCAAHTCLVHVEKTEAPDRQATSVYRDQARRQMAGVR